MFSRLILALFAVSLLPAIFGGPIQNESPLNSPPRILIRHHRSVERENVPATERTVVLQTDPGTETEAAPTANVSDLENEISHGEKDSKDFVEFDYNPMNDSLFFNGRIPQMFHGHRNIMGTFEDMFTRMMEQTSRMFHRFPVASPELNNAANYPDNYNGTVEEIVTIGGQQFRKKQHIINKTGDGSRISIISTVYEPVDGSPAITSSSSSSSSSTSIEVEGSPASSDVSISSSSGSGSGSTTRDDLTDGKIINY